MVFKFISIVLLVCLSGCMVLPVSDPQQSYQCALSTDKKYLKLVNLFDGDTSFYAWEDEMASIITVPTTAVLSAIYVSVNNVIHIGEKSIRCSSSKNTKGNKGAKPSN